ncbi:MAG: hypothetical protein GXO62_02365 [Epsilonproteobacteria bacterium]|nr:hypothetical protein [Campylobacterota bacterium]
MLVTNSLEEIFKSKYFPYQNETLIKHIVSNINEMFEFHIGMSKTFIVEKYKEKEWSNLFSLHYSTVFKELKNYVLRIHLFKNEFNNIASFHKKIKNYDERYIGYITIRILPVWNKAIISRARLRTYTEQYGIDINQKYIINLCNTKVHILDKTFSFSSFPFYSQDNVVSVCAHADLLMVSKYMYKKFNFNLIEIDTILNSVDSLNGRKIPSDGLILEQIISVLDKNRYNPSLYKAKGDKIVRVELDSDKFKDINFELDIFEIIDTAIRSSLVVLLILSSHTVVIGGYFYKDNEKFYIIYDDSSFYIKKLTDKETYSAAVSQTRLREFLNEIYENKKDETYLVIPTFDRLYFRYPSLFILLNVFIKEKIEGNFEIEHKLRYNSELIDNVILKKKKKELKSKHFPHYVWYVRWLDGSEDIGYSIIDATAHKNDFFYSCLIDFKEHGND